MKISETIEVDRPVDQVWALFQDIPELARCLPGAEVTADKGDGVYAGKVGVKLGPMTASFEGDATVTADAQARTGSVEGKGVDKGGGSVGQVTVTYRIAEGDASTTVAFDADVQLSGAAAQFGRTGLITEMSRRLIGEFVDCVEAKLAATSTDEAAEIQAADVKGLSLFFASLGTTIAGFFRRLFGRAPDE